jgi:Ser/Thr protein kinase RdoA (MazF antagonist)
VSPSIPDAAASAAVTVAASLGVACAEPVVLADGANIIVRLSPSPVVAKVAASTRDVRADVAARLQRELDLTLFLDEAGFPVMTPSREVPATVHRGDGHVMSFWTYLPPSGPARRPDEDTIGSMLRDLHSVLRGGPVTGAFLDSLDDIPAFLARPQSASQSPSQSLLTAADVTALTAAYTELTTAVTQAAAGAPVQALHGDAGAGNLMATGGRWVWHDFEDTCTGPVAWDLAATTASPRLDRARILAAYKDPVDQDLLRTCEELRRLHLTIWYALYAERLPACRPRAEELLASWRR